MIFALEMTIFATLPHISSIVLAGNSIKMLLSRHQSRQRRGRPWAYTPCGEPCGAATEVGVAEY